MVSRYQNCFLSVLSSVANGILNPVEFKGFPPLCSELRQGADCGELFQRSFEIGVLLLDRTAESVSLTEAGSVFLDEARAVLERADQAIRKAQAVTGADTELHVGYSPTPTTRLLSVTLRAYQLAMPKVRVRLHDLRNDENFRGLREGRLQLAFVFQPRTKSALRNLRFEALTKEHGRLAVSPKHPFARRNAVSLAEAAREPFVGYNREEYRD